MRVDSHSHIDGNVSGTAILRLRQLGITPDELSPGGTPDFCIWETGEGASRRWGHVYRKHGQATEYRPDLGRHVTLK